MHGNRRQKVTFWFLVWFFGTLAVMVVGLVVEQLLAPPPPNPLTQIPTAPADTPSAPAAKAPAAKAPATKARPSPTAPALTGPLQVIQGKQQVNGVELGFPHSTAGAVSAADADLTEVFSTLDPDRSAAVMRMVADPSYPNAPQQVAQGPVNLRKGLGLPTTGPVPAGASVQAEPVEYQVRDVAADTVTVLLLCEFTTTTPDQGTATRTGVFDEPVHWYAGDWKVLPPPATNYGNLSAEPDSPQAASLGWQQLEPAGS